MRGEMCQAAPASASRQPPVNCRHLPCAECVAGCDNVPASVLLCANGSMCTGLGTLV